MKRSKLHLDEEVSTAAALSASMKYLKRRIDGNYFADEKATQESQQPRLRNNIDVISGEDFTLNKRLALNHELNIPNQIKKKTDETRRDETVLGDIQHTQENLVMLFTFSFTMIDDQGSLQRLFFLLTACEQVTKRCIATVCSIARFLHHKQYQIMTTF